MLGVGRRNQPWITRAMFLSLVLVIATARQVGAETPVVGEIVSTYQIEGDDALVMPTDVAVDAEGRVIVADGSNNRVVIFDADGAVRERVRSIGAESLSRPVSVATDAAGRIYIADTGNHRILVRSPSGALERTITPVAEKDGDPPDLTGVAVSADGAFVWMVDNDNHRLIRFDSETGGQTIIGKQG